MFVSFKSHLLTAMLRTTQVQALKQLTSYYAIYLSPVARYSKLTYFTLDFVTLLEITSINQRAILTTLGVLMLQQQEPQIWLAAE